MPYMVLVLHSLPPMDIQTSRYVENAQAQMRKGILDLCILLAIAKGKEMYASDILEALKAKHLLVVEGTLYPLLNRLRTENLLDYSWQESKSGPPRKYYRLTPRGQNAVKELMKAWSSLESTIATFR